VSGNHRKTVDEVVKAVLSGALTATTHSGQNAAHLPISNALQLADFGQQALLASFELMGQIMRMNARNLGALGDEVVVASLPSARPAPRLHRASARDGVA
jgi:hypothetical protein